MRSRIQLFHSAQSIALRPKTLEFSARRVPLCLRSQQRNITADEKLVPESEEPKGPNQDQLPHVSEEAAATGKITGEGGPELEQSTPVQEILKRDGKSQEKAPKIIQDGLSGASPKGSRSYSTSTPRHAETAMTEPKSAEVENPGHIFGLPSLPLPSTSHLKHRYDPVVHQVTNLLMRDGKLSQAQRNMALILERLRTAATPSLHPKNPLLPGSPPPNHLPLNPILYLTLAIDSVAPLLRIRSQRGAAGGGMALQIPIPLNIRQRRRTAVMWILESANKRQSAGSGKKMFAHKIADELIAIVDGNSSVWDRRNAIHKLAVAARANLSFGTRRRPS